MNKVVEVGPLDTGQPTTRGEPDPTLMRVILSDPIDTRMMALSKRDGRIDHRSKTDPVAFRQTFHRAQRKAERAPPRDG